MAVHALEAVVESSEELTRQHQFSCLLREEQGDRLFEKGLQYCRDFFVFKAKCLNYLVSFINFTLAGQFVNSVNIRYAHELFQGRVRAPNYLVPTLFLREKKMWH